MIWWYIFGYLVIGGIVSGLTTFVVNKGKDITLGLFIACAITWPLCVTLVLLHFLIAIVKFLWLVLLKIFSSPVIWILIVIGIIFYFSFIRVKADELTSKASLPIAFEEQRPLGYSYRIKLLAEVMYHENWHTDPERLAAYYTGAVVMNRVHAKCWPNTVESVVYQKGQYSTTGKLFTKTLPEECYRLAVKVYNGTPDVPKNVVFQAMFKQGSGLWQKVNTDYFCYGRIE